MKRIHVHREPDHIVIRIDRRYRLTPEQVKLVTSAICAEALKYENQTYRKINHGT